MEMKTVRAKLGDRWAALTYNAATGRYEGVLTPPGTSIHQPDGYFDVQVEAVNQAGETASVSAAQLPALRLVVRETTAPTLTLVSPAPGYLTTQTPAVVFQAVDEAGGSGVDPDQFSVSPAGTVTRTAVSGGYRFTWTPAAPWADGAHTITASVRDYDGNESTVSGAYIVDTVPPELLLQQPHLRHVVDDEAVSVTGEAWDVTAPAVAVMVSGRTVPVVGGRFQAVVPLEIGENRIPVTAVDGAGNQTTQEVYMIRLVTDRTQGDVDRVMELCVRGYGGWTDADRAWWASTRCLRGSYDHRDLNRVGAAVQFLTKELQRRGYIVAAQPKANWAESDAPVRSQMASYLDSIAAVREAQGIYLTEIPWTMDNLTVDGANAMEQALVEADAVFPYYTAWTAGEITCGGV